MMEDVQIRIYPVEYDLSKSSKLEISIALDFSKSASAAQFREAGNCIQCSSCRCQ